MMYYNYYDCTRFYKVEDTEEAHLIYIKAAGYRKENIQIEKVGSDLVIKGTTDKILHDNLDYEFSLPSDVDKVLAKLEDGILIIKLEKKKKESSKIEIS